MKILLFSLLFIISFFCFSQKQENFIKIDLIAKNYSKSYYILFSRSSSTFISYTEPY